MLFRAFHLLAHAFGHGLTLVPTVFGSRIFGTLGRQTGQGVLDLLRNLFVADFRTDDGFRPFVLLVAAAFTRFRLVLLRIRTVGCAAVLAAAALSAAGFAVVLVRTALSGCAAPVDIHLLLLQALALMTAARNESRDVHRTEHLRALKLLDGRTEYMVFGCGRCCRLGRCGGCSFRFRCCRRWSGGGNCRSFRSQLCFSGRSHRRDCGRGSFRSRRPYRLRFRSFDRGPDRLCRRFGCRSRRFRRLGLGFRRRSVFRPGRKVDPAENLRLLDFVLHADDVALDDHLLPLLALLLLRSFERYGGLFHGNPFANRFAGIAGGAVGAELLLQNGIRRAVDQRVGRSVALDALLVQEVRDRVQTHVELLGNLNEP